MAEAVITRRQAGGGSIGLEGTEATFVAKDKLKINDIVYTIKGDIEAEARFDALSSYVYALTFSPNGTKLVLGGDFTGYAKIYSVSGTTVTFVSDIYADTGTTALDNYVSAAAFSPDGTELVLGGYFTGMAKIYSVSGTTVTFVSDIYADTGTTALSDTVRALAFSSDGTELVLGGYFTGKAKIYSVSGDTITFSSDLYADAVTMELSDNVMSNLAKSEEIRKILLDIAREEKIHVAMFETVLLQADEEFLQVYIDYALARR